MAQHVEDLIGDAVYDLGGAKIGKVKRVYVDNASGAPTWASVSTGLFSEDSLVPLAGAQLRQDPAELQVRVHKEAVKTAPHLAHDGLITQDSENDLFIHYGVDPNRAGWEDYGRHAGTATGEEARAAGTAGVTGTAAPKPTTPDMPASRRPDFLVRSEERLNIGTRQEVSGRARLHKYVVSEEQTVTVPTSHEEVHIEREPITDISALPADFGEQEQEVTLHQDRVIVDKEMVPVERVRLVIDQVEEEQSITETVRKERIEIEGMDRDDKLR
ncbi:PRC and DUF2382 domain-containing protein [Nocardia sp. NBC_01329]|uniref:PRC and DUF2382 domain-containing protein n=1 Tax=Nocardia sp. NBC_01329 TaxID=2903594 RepID=UPI002E1594A1|nr:PRC and DUF2382 domain-containing protein [Nocardia sp. NBC_01329]